MRHFKKFSTDALAVCFTCKTELVFRSSVISCNARFHNVRVLPAWSSEADAIPDDEVQSYLRFNTQVVGGRTFRHLMLDSIFALKLEEHTIEQGETLCRRMSLNYHRVEGRANCPGCIAVAKGVAIRDLTREIGGR